MTDLRTQLDKIRSDAAECMLLSKLVPDGKGQVFVKTAEHLNELVQQLEKSPASSIADAGTGGVSLFAPQARGCGEVVRAETNVPTAPSRRGPRWALVALIVMTGVLAVSSKHGAEYWSRYVSNSMSNLSLSTQDQTAKALSALLSDQQRDREKIIGQLDELRARMDLLLASLNNPGAGRADVATKSNEAADEQARTALNRAPAPELISSSEGNASPALAGSPDATKAESRLPGAEDSVGSIPASQRQAERPRKSATGPAGCTQFRSFDPVSETYTTFDGRRRECRQ